MEVEYMAFATLDKPLPPAFVIQLLHFCEIFSLPLSSGKNLPVVSVDYLNYNIKRS